MYSRDLKSSLLDAAKKIPTNSQHFPAEQMSLEREEEERDGMVSFQSELPETLQIAMTSFIERYPNWDQYRLVKAALAGFLVQNGVKSRSIIRLYVGNMFSLDSMINGS